MGEGMVFLNLFGVEIALDFTLPAMLAWMALTLPQGEFFGTISACILHEMAHLLMILAFRQKPSALYISGIGMRLTLSENAMGRLPQMCCILAAGVLANFGAAVCFLACGQMQTAVIHFSLGCFNLLPFRSTDGGTLIYALLEHLWISTNPHRVVRVWRGIWVTGVIGVVVWMYRYGAWNGAFVGMLGLMVIAEMERTSRAPS